MEENEERLDAEFALADTDGNNRISFGEFCRYHERLFHLHDSYHPLALYGRYYERLFHLYDSYVDDDDDDDLAEEVAMEAADDVVPDGAHFSLPIECLCGDTFLPAVLPAHMRSCEACKPKVIEKIVEVERIVEKARHFLYCLMSRDTHFACYD